MGVSFFQTAPHNHLLRYAILCNAIAFVFIVFAFGYSYAVSSSTSKLSSDVFSTEFDDSSVFATLGPLEIALKNSTTGVSRVVCPKDELDKSLATAVLDFDECDRFQDATKASLGFDGITFVSLLIIYCVQRYVTARGADDEAALAACYFWLQTLPVTAHLLARMIFDGAATRSAIAFLRANDLLVGVPAAAAATDTSIGLFYGPVQRLNTAAACALALALVFATLALIRVKVQERIDSVELLRECAARRRGETPAAEQRPLRWMLDPSFHPLFDEDELAVIKAKIEAGKKEASAYKNNSSDDAATKSSAAAGSSSSSSQLEQQLVAAEAEWRRQQDEAAREKEAYALYAHRIRREERVVERGVVDDWQRQQDVWEQRKEAVRREFEAMGLVASAGSAAVPAGATNASTSGGGEAPSAAAAAAASN
jgi:hypothetical protein